MSDVIRLHSTVPAGKPPHCEIKAYRDLHNLFSVCRRTGSIGVASGPTGCGKTTAAMAFAAGERDAIYVRMTAAANTMQPFLVKLAAAMRTYATPNLGKAELFDIVAERLGRASASTPVVIVDEMNHGSGEIVHVVRDLWDATRCGFVMLGTSDMETLWAEKTGRRAGKGDAFAAFRARVRITIELDRPDVADVAALCLHLDLSGKRERDLLGRCIRQWDGLHRLESILATARELAGTGNTVNATHLIDAAKLTGVA